MNPVARTGIALVGFDADDTLWKSEDYYRDAQAQFERIVGGYVDLADVGDRLYAVEKRNLALFGYGVKGMVLSMVEAAVEITDARISASDLHRVVGLGKTLLQHPVDVLDGVREADVRARGLAIGGTAVAKAFAGDQLGGALRIGAANRELIVARGQSRGKSAMFQHVMPLFHACSRSRRMAA